MLFQNRLVLMYEKLKTNKQTRKLAYPTSSKCLRMIQGLFQGPKHKFGMFFIVLKTKATHAHLAENRTQQKSRGIKEQFLSV